MEKVMKSLFVAVFMSVMFIGCTTCTSTRLISDLPRNVNDNRAVIVGKMKALKPPNQLIPSFNFADGKGKIALTIDNTGWSTLYQAASDKELSFFGAVPPGTYHLNEYWWANTGRKKFTGPIWFKAEAGKINYVGDILLTRHVSHGAIELSLTIEKNIADIRSSENDTIQQIDFPLESNILQCQDFFA